MVNDHITPGQTITNRQALNQYLRKEAEKQLKYIENISDEELISHTMRHPNFQIRINIHDKICYLKAITGAMPIGNEAAVLQWLKQTAPEGISWKKLLQLL